MTPRSIFPMPPFGDPADLTWEALRPGVDAAWIYRDEPAGPRAALLRYQPGARVEPHQHLGYEHIFVLQGSQSDGTRDYPAGTLTVFPPGSRHAIESRDGCLVYAVWSAPVAFD
jgi:anti-sigma factor ChrR (cupin superfamily)